MCCTNKFPGILPDIITAIASHKPKSPLCDFMRIQGFTKRDVCQRLELELMSSKIKPERVAVHNPKYQVVVVFSPSVERNMVVFSKSILNITFCTSI
jgi:hypothetical protein